MALLEISLLGGFTVLRAGTPVIGFESVRVRALLAFLAIESDRGHTRDALASLLWPERSDTAARNNLRQALNNLQRTIQNQNATPPFVIVTRDEIRFNRAADVWVDVWEFQAARSDRARLAAAADLYRGELLPQFFVNDSPEFEEWLLLTREKLHRQGMDVLEQLLYAHQSAGNAYAQVVRYATRLLELESWYEPAHRALMQEYARAGNRSAALAQYETLRRTLSEGLGVEPSAESNALYAQLRQSAGENVLDTHVSRVLNLPGALTPFIGRAVELETLSERFQAPECRVLTLLGQGGIGKTRLAVQFASRYAGQHNADVCFVPCDALTTADELPHAIANALQLRQTGAVDIAATLRNFESDWLLVLDNLEQIQGAGAFVFELVRAAPRVRILATSRERLDIAGEWVWQMGGLGAPENLARLDESEAAQLLLSTARRVGAVWSEPLPDAERDAIRAICELVDGMPLALELAGANARTFSFKEIAEEIRRSLDFLTNAPVGAPARHASVRFVIEQSWARLNPTTQMFFGQMRIFHGGFTRDAAMQVARADGRTLMTLGDKSLVRRAANGRYTLHPLITQFIALHADVAQGGGDDALAERHGRYYLEWVIAHAPALDDENARRVLDEFRLELENVRAAWHWAVTQQSVGLGVRAVSALGQFFQAVGLLQPGLEWLNVQVHDAAWRGELYAARAELLLRTGEYDRALATAQDAQALGAQLQNNTLVAQSALVRGIALTRKGDFGAAQTCLEQTVQLAKPMRNDLHVQALLSLDAIGYYRGDVDASIHWTQEALRLSEQARNRRLEAQALNDMARNALEMRDYERARVTLERALALNEMLGNPWASTRVLTNLGALHGFQAHYKDARTWFDRALHLAQEIGERSQYCTVMVNLCRLWYEAGAYVTAENVSEQSYALALELDSQWAILGSLLNLAGSRLQRGNAPDAVRVCRQILTMSGTNSLLGERVSAYLILVRAYSAQMLWEDAYAACLEMRSNVDLDKAYEGAIWQLEAEQAYIAWQRGQRDEALALTENVMMRLRTFVPYFWSEWFRTMWLMHQVLTVVGDARAADVLARARSQIEFILSGLADETMRASFTNAPMVRALL